MFLKTSSSSSVVMVAMVFSLPLLCELLGFGLGLGGCLVRGASGSVATSAGSAGASAAGASVSVSAAGASASASAAAASSAAATSSASGLLGLGSGKASPPATRWSMSALTP